MPSLVTSYRRSSQPLSFNPAQLLTCSSHLLTSQPCLPPKSSFLTVQEISTGIYTPSLLDLLPLPHIYFATPCVPNKQHWQKTTSRCLLLEKTSIQDANEDTATTTSDLHFQHTTQKTPGTFMLSNRSRNSHFERSFPCPSECAPPATILIQTTRTRTPEAGVYRRSRRFSSSLLPRPFLLPATSATANLPKKHISTLLPTAKAVGSVLASYASANVMGGTWMETLGSQSRKHFQDLSTCMMWTTNNSTIPT